MQHPPCHSEIQQILPLLKPPHTTFWSHFLACEWQRLWEHLNAPCMERSPICVCKRERDCVCETVRCKIEGEQKRRKKVCPRGVTKPLPPTQRTHIPLFVLSRMSIASYQGHVNWRPHVYWQLMIKCTEKWRRRSSHNDPRAQMCSCVILVWNPFDTGVLGLVLHTHIHSLIFVSQSPVCTRHVHGYVKQGETSLSHPNCLAVTPPGWSLVLLWTFTITAGTHPVGVCHQLRGGK